MSAGGAVIGALRVILGADTAEFETGLKNASVKLGNFGASIARVGAMASVAIAGMATATAMGVKGAINSFDDLEKTSQRIGVPVEALSALRYAAKLSDVSAETLDKSMGKLAKTIIEAAQGSQTAIHAFRALGVNFRDANGGIKPLNDLLPDLADKFSRMEDGTKKTALAMQIFGRAGASMIPLLNSGRAGLAAATAEAKAFGIIVGGDTTKAAEAFNDNLTRLTTMSHGVFAQFTANIIPVLARFSDLLVEGARNSGFVYVAAGMLTTAFNAMARIAIVAYDNFTLLVKIGAIFVGAQIGAAAISFGLAFVKLAAAIRVTAIALAAFEAIRGVSTRGILLIAGLVALAAGAFDNFSEKIKQIGANLTNLLPEGTGEAVNKILSGMGLNLRGLTTDLQGWTAASGEGKKPLFDPTILKTSKDALDSFIDSTKKSIAAMQATAATMGMAAFETNKMKVALEAAAIAKANHIPLTIALREKIDALAVSFATLKEKTEDGRQVWEQTRTAAEQFGATMMNLNGMLQRGAIDADTYARAVAQAQDKMMQASPYAQALGNSLTTAFDSAIQGGKSLQEVLRNLLQDLARALANQAFKTLLYGNASTGGSFTGILGSLFGLFPGFANGGSVTVGGSGGIDSQLVAFRATPGEQVSISKNGAGAGGAVQVVSNFSPTFINASPESEARMRAEMRRELAMQEARLKTTIAKTSLGYSL